MFYSQTFLARKGPLSTVWIAAHLQHRLKKPQYTSTDIPSTVKHIMDPGVPIALRMSAFLLLGVVRIYSKKVDYLLHDCNAVRTLLYKEYGSVSNTSNTLAEGARHAPFEAVTDSWPETFELNAVNLGFEIDPDGVEDMHQRSQEEITLPDQIPVAMDSYLAVSFNDEEMLDSSHVEVPPDCSASQMEDIVPQSSLANAVGVQDCGPSIQRESPSMQHTLPHSSTNPEVAGHFGPTDENPQEMEVLRDAMNDSIIIENPPDVGNNNTEPNRDPDQTINEKDPNKDHDETMIENYQIPEAINELMVSSPTPGLRPTTPVTSQGCAIDPQVCEGGHSFHLASPPTQQPQPRGRKRKQFFDEPIVLTNKFMRGTLNNTRDILRKRRDVPCSILGTWKLNNSRRKEQIFDQPLLTGICKDLSDISKRDFICSRPHLVISDENCDASVTRATSPINQITEEPKAATPPVTAPHIEEDDVDAEATQASPTYQILEEPRTATPVTALQIEILRHHNIADTAHPTIIAQDVGVGVDTGGDCRGANRGDDHTSPTSAETVPTPYFPTPPVSRGFEVESPSTYRDDTFLNSDISDTHQFTNFAEKEELDFLLAENNTPASSQGSQGTIKSTGTFGKMSERTRGVVQYLKEHSPITPILEDPAGGFSLNNILEGKIRKIAARMFFEVLVLKTHDHIDVQQEEPYGDVSLKLTASFSNTQI